MKGKATIAFSLAVLMTAVTPLSAYASTSIHGNILWDEATPYDDYEANGNLDISIPEGHTATVGQINGGNNVVNISGGGTLNVTGDDSAAISGSSISIEGTTVNASSSTTNVIVTEDNLNIQNSTVILNGTGENSGGILASRNVTIEDSNVVIRANGEHAIYSPYGDISINNSNVDASSQDGAIFTERGNINIGDGLIITTPQNGYVGTCGSGNAIYGQNGPQNQYDTGATKVVINNDTIEPEAEENEATEEYYYVAQNAANETQTLTEAPALFVKKTVIIDLISMGELSNVERIVSMISAAPYGGTIELNVTSESYLSIIIVSALESRSDVSLKIKVTINGVPYVINIPAGFNLRALLGSDIKIDMQKLIQAFGVAG